MESIQELSSIPASGKESEAPIKLLKVVSLLLSYPTEPLQAYSDELQDVIDGAREIPRHQREQLTNCLRWLVDSSLMDVQEAYGELFERGRHLSLLLFEHVHGESRDRGQAMVDLMAQYEQKGLSIGVKELPDYLPLYLEYLAICDGLTAREGLADVAHILGALNARLLEKESPYAGCFEALITISGSRVEMDKLREQATLEQPDDSLEALDKIWEEEMVTFDAASARNSCSSSGSQHPMQAKQTVPEALHFIDPGTDNQKGAF